MLKHTLLLAALLFPQSMTSQRAEHTHNLVSAYNWLNLTNGSLYTGNNQGNATELLQYDNNSCGNIPGNPCGSVIFATGPLESGSIADGGTFSSSGSSFAVIGKPHRSVPHPTIFSGVFTGTITWTFNGMIGVAGLLHNGQSATGAVVENIEVNQLGSGWIELGTVNLTTAGN